MVSSTSTRNLVGAVEDDASCFQPLQVPSVKSDSPSLNLLTLDKISGLASIGLLLLYPATPDWNESCIQEKVKDGTHVTQSPTSTRFVLSSIVHLRRGVRVERFIIEPISVFFLGRMNSSHLVYLRRG